MAKILIIDDDTFICKALQKQLQNNGYAADAAFTGNSGLKKIKQNKYEVVLCDFRLPDKDGLEILQQVKKLNIKTTFVIITAYADVRMAVKLMKLGATDYLTKPVIPEEIINLVKKATSKSQTQNDYAIDENDFVIGQSETFKKAVKFAQKVAPTNMSVLIEGETGTGKEYIARYIHTNSKRSKKPFVAIDCGAIPRELAGSELFGHVKGAFTGAVADKTGVFRQAHGGTLFLDEIGNLDYEIQVQLLRVLQEKQVTRLGQSKTEKVDARIIAATNEPLNKSDGISDFREDLLHRINEFKIVLPPLRKRREDIVFFADYFMKNANKELGTEIKGFDAETLNILKNYSWFGNIRELRNVVKRAVLLSPGKLVNSEALPVEIVNAAKKTQHEKNENDEGKYNLKKMAADAEKEAIVHAIVEAGYNKSEAARVLGIDRKTLYNKIKQYGIDI
jgi:two-component system response regulator HydG